MDPQAAFNASDDRKRQFRIYLLPDRIYFMDAETMLQSATNKFVSRFNRLEDELNARGKKLGEVGLAELDEIWNHVKMTKSEGRMPN